jgi:hypothetical protein
MTPNFRNKSTQRSRRVLCAYSREPRRRVEIPGEHRGYFTQEEFVVAGRGSIPVDFNVEDFPSSKTNLCPPGGLQDDRS